MNIKKLVIFGGIGLILVLGAWVGANQFGLIGGGDHGAEPSADSDHALAAEAPRVAEPPPPRAPASAPAHDSYDDEDEAESVYKTAANQTHIINLAQGESGRGLSFLRCQISIIIIDEELGKAMTSDTPTYESEKAKAIVLDRLTEIELAEVNEPEIKEVFAADVKDRLNEQFRPKPSSDKKAPPRPRRPISEVLVVQWAIQRS